MAENDLSFKTAFKKFLVEPNSSIENNTVESNKETENAGVLGAHMIDKDSEVDAKNNCGSVTLSDEERREANLARALSLLKLTEDPEYMCRVFVANLHVDTTEQDLINFFTDYGEIQFCAIIRDYMTGESSGIGSILFAEASSVDRVLSSHPLELNNKVIALFVCEQDNSEPEAFRKVFVLNLHPDTTEKDLHDYFQQWGRLTECNLIEEQSNKAGYLNALVTFENFETMNNVLANRYHKLKNHILSFALFCEHYFEPECFRKLFIEHMNRTTNNKSLKQYFEKYGDVKYSVIMKGRNSRKSTGTGFVVFARSFMVDLAVSASPHRIDNRKVHIGRYTDEPELAPESERKLFLKNLSYETEEDTLIYHFEQYGVVESAAVFKVIDTGKGSGFGYVIFRSAETVKKVEALKHEIDYRRVQFIPYDPIESFIHHRRRTHYPRERAQNNSSPKGRELTHSSREAERKQGAIRKTKQLTNTNTSYKPKKAWANRQRSHTPVPRYHMNDLEGAGVNIFPGEQVPPLPDEAELKANHYRMHLNERNVWISDYKYTNSWIPNFLLEPIPVDPQTDWLVTSDEVWDVRSNSCGEED